MTTFSQELEKYNYSFPKELIASSPASPRDSARLLVYDKKTKKTEFDTFKNLHKYLPHNSVLVLNDTKVIPARFSVTKPTGGKINLLYIAHNKNNLTVLADKSLKKGLELFINKQKKLTVENKNGPHYLMSANFPLSDFLKLLNKIGKTPLPPYIKNTPLKEKKLRTEYQTVFAKITGSIAAPTASLHFTKNSLNQLKKSGIEIVYVTLHVGLGTFASLTESQLKNRKLHSEWFSVSEETAKKLNLAKKQNKKIIAVGTTAVRTLESATTNTQIKKLSGDTTLFIHAPYRFKFVDGIITNFHVPKSSLIMLVSAFVGRKTILSLYRTAIHKKFRLFSFGDAMLLK